VRKTVAIRAAAAAATTASSVRGISTTVDCACALAPNAIKAKATRIRFTLASTNYFAHMAMCACGVQNVR
jgi:uncharacterized protein (DUF1499 family)